MPVKLLMALTLIVTCAISLRCVNARFIRKSSLSDDVTNDDVTGDNVVGHDASSHVAIVKRSASSTAGSRGRSYVGGGGSLDVVPVMSRRSAAGAASFRPEVVDEWSPADDGARSQFAALLADAAMLERLRHHRRPDRGDVWAAPYGRPYDKNIIARNIQAYGTEDPFAEAVKRTIGHLRSPRELHPVYLGLGQNAASAALNTYASLLADEKRRENLEQQQQGSANPVRFIGKR